MKSHNVRCRTRFFGKLNTRSLRANRPFTTEDAMDTEGNISLALVSFVSLCGERLAQS